MMRNTLRKIIPINWLISRKSHKKKDDDHDDDHDDDESKDDHFYDAVDEPQVDNYWNNPPENKDPPQPPPLSDTDSLFDEGSKLGSHGPAPFDRLPSSAQTSPLLKSPWSAYTQQASMNRCGSYVGLMCSLVREEGHIYSLAASGDLLYTGSSSKNIRIWKHHMEYSGFKSHSGLVKAIVISGEKIFTGHQDGKIRVWKASRKDPKLHKKIGTLPNFQSVFKKSIKPKNYTLRRNQSGVWIKHFDAISSLCLNEDQTLLYSGSWDKTMKVWRVSDFKCLESIEAHDDVINTVVAGFHGFVFSGSADGMLKVWQKESQGNQPKHYFSQILLKQEFAVTSLAVNPTAMVVYAGCSDGIVHFWEHEKLTRGGSLRGHKLAVLCLVVSANMVFSGSADKNICVWQRDDSGAHRCLYILNGHTGPVKCLAVDEEQKEMKSHSNDGRNTCMLYSGSLDKSVKIWRMCPQRCHVDDKQLPPPSPQRINGLRLSRLSHRRASQLKK